MNITCVKYRCGHEVATILLDDVLEVITFKRAALKMDIQSFEHKAFSHSSKLLNNVNISDIFMEWSEMAKYYVSLKHKSKDKTMVLNMIDMFLSLDYSPYHIKDNAILNLKKWQKWPSHMVWSRKYD